MRPRLEIPADSRWLYDQNDHNIWTAWANQRLTFNIGSAAEIRKVHFEVTARNQGKVPPSYDFFNVDVKVEGRTKGTIKIKASQTEYQTGGIDIDIQPGEQNVDLVWTNDKHDPPYDANIMISNVSATTKE